MQRYPKMMLAMLVLFAMPTAVSAAIDWQKVNAAFLTAKNGKTPVVAKQTLIDCSGQWEAWAVATEKARIPAADLAKLDISLQSKLANVISIGWWADLSEEGFSDEVLEEAGVQHTAELSSILATGDGSAMIRFAAQMGACQVFD